MKPSTPSKKQVISYTNLPGGLGLGLLITIWLLMDRLGAPGWSYGLFAVFAFFILGAGMHKILTSEQVDLFKRTPAVPPTVSPKPLKDTITGTKIDIHRNFVDQLEVTICDDFGRKLFTFDPKNIGLGEVLRLHGLRVDVDVTYTN